MSSTASPSTSEHATAASACEARARLSTRQATDRQGPCQRCSGVPLHHSDPELARLLRCDPKRGGQLLFERYGRIVRHVLIRALGRDAEVDDLVHEVFLTALGNINRLQKDAALRGWLAGIALNKARNLLRSRRGHALTQLEILPEIPARTSPTVHLDARDALRRAHRLIQRLPLDERAAFTLKHIHGLAIVAVAQELRVSLSTAKRKTERAESSLVRWAELDGVLAEWVLPRNLGVTAASVETATSPPDLSASSFC